MAATTGYCRSPSPELRKPNPRANGFASTRRIHFSRFPLLFHPIAVTIATSFSGQSKFLQLPFRSPLSPSLPSTAHPGCVVLGNTTRLRRRRLPAVGKPAPLLPVLPVCLGWKEEKRRDGGRRRERKRKRKRTDRWAPAQYTFVVFLFISKSNL